MPRARFAGPLLATLIGLHLWPAPTAQAAAKTFRQASAKDFEEGEADGTTILPTGELVPGLVATRVGVDAAFVWCSVASRDGATGYFGTGDDGKIFARTLGGKRAADKSAAHKLATLDAAWVTALATRADGTLLAGATPGGKLYTVEPDTSKTPGATKLLATLAAAHVWAVVRDDKAALTYVGTGSPGKVFAVDDKGKTREVWDAHDKHVVSLMRDSDGALLAGTSEDAILYRVLPDGRATALQDFEAEEVRAIVRAPSGLYVAVNDFEKTAIPPVAGPAPAKGTKIVLATGGPPPSAGTLPRPGQRKAKSAVYRIESDGRIEQMFALPDGYLTALAVADDGAVLAASGTQGHVYRITAERTASLVVDVPERQALTLLRAGAEVWVGTGDSAGLYRAHAPADNAAHYLSKVFDAESPARWGTLRWQGADVTFETRSGNTAKPDAGWSAWQPTASKATDANGGAGAVVSPPARYLQYQARLASRKGRLRGVTAYYLPQ
ncbi:MAG TPA: hypothetical protein VHU40_21420, partial [Polyangia bacterium]|nr:hypothetical protein [Polyangia bacterium]